MNIQRACGMLLVFAVTTVRGQYVVGARAGSIQFTAGEVFVNGQRVRATPKHFPFLEEGQELSTRQGRVEILLGQGVFLRLDLQSSVRLTSASLQDTRVDIEAGSALVEVVKLNKDAHIQVSLRNAITEFRGMGVYRFDLPPGELRVFGGQAEVSDEDRKIELTRGKAVRYDSGLAASNFDLKQTDGLHDWSARRSFVTFFTHRLRQTMNWEIRLDGSAYNRDFNRKYYLRNASRAFIRNGEMQLK